MALALVASIFTACQKNDSPVALPERAPAPSRVETPGVVYLPLNIILKGTTKNIYQYTWSKQVDLDSDTLNDLNFSLSIGKDRYGNFYYIGTSISCIQQGGGVISDFLPSAFPSNPSVWQARTVPAGAVISGSLQTFANPAYVSTYTYSYYFGARRGGTIIGKGDKHVGFRFVSKGQTYYGWIKVNVSANSQTFTIREAAFMNIPDLPISAGQVL